MKSSRKLFVCPVCSGEVSPNAKACRDCGACDLSGWRQESVYDGLDLPEEHFDYDAFLEAEFSGKPRKTSWQWFWWLVAVVLLLAMGAVILHW